MARVGSSFRLAVIAFVIATVALIGSERETTAASPFDLTGVAQIQLTIPAAGSIPEVHANCIMRSEQPAAAGVPDNATARAMCYEVLKTGTGTPAVPPPPPPPYRAALHRELSGAVASDGSVTLEFLACTEIELDSILTGLSVVLTATADKAGWGASAGTVTLTLDQDGTPDCDVDGSTVVQNNFTPVNLAMNNDLDGDGCTDWEELSDTETSGGLRDPYNPYDLFDPNLDKSVAFGDFLEILQHFNTNDADKTASPNRNSDPFAPISDTDPGVYSPRFDRSGVIPGGFPWNENAPDGAVGFGDFLSLLRQFGHSCGGEPN